MSKTDYTPISSTFSSSEEAIEWFYDNCIEYISLSVINHKVDEFQMLCQEQNIQFSEQQQTYLLELSNNREVHAVKTFIDMGFDPALNSPNTNYKNTFVTFIEQSSFFGAKEASETTEDHKRRLEKAFKEQEMLSHMISNDSVKESLLSRSLPHSKHDIETYDKFAELLKQKQSPATT